MKAAHILDFDVYQYASDGRSIRGEQGEKQNKDLAFPSDFFPTVKEKQKSLTGIFTSEHGSDDSRNQTSSINGQIKDGKKSVSLFFL